MTDALYDIPGYEGLYAITRDGKIWSYPKKQTFGIRKPIWLKQSINKKGYARANLSKNDIRKEYFTHRLVALTFLPKPAGDRMEINHKNGIKLDNRVENLEWVTHQENVQHSWLNGLSKKNYTLKKYTPEFIYKVKKLYDTGDYSFRELGRMFNASDITMKKHALYSDRYIKELINAEK